MRDEDWAVLRDPKVMTDEEKHAWAKQRNGIGAIVLPPSVYDAAETSGQDMRWYVRAKPVPREVDQ